MYNQEYQRSYYMKNCEKIKEISRNYRLNNKEKLNTAYSCACGGKFTMKNISIHTKSKKHMRYVYLQQPILEDGVIMIAKPKIFTDAIDINFID